MARPKSLKPSYCHHKASGRAYVTLDGQRVYLGAFGTPASRDAYDQAIGEWIARGRRAAAAKAPAAGSSGITVTELIDGFWTHATGYYVGTTASRAASWRTSEARYGACENSTAPHPPPRSAPVR